MYCVYLRTTAVCARPARWCDCFTNRWSLEIDWPYALVKHWNSTHLLISETNRETHTVYLCSKTLSFINEIYSYLIRRVVNK